jgi:hypothetical protein
MKVVAYGFLLNGAHSYLFNPWNVLDFFIVIMSIITVLNVGSFKIVKTVRMVRVLRPLKMITKNEGLKIAVSCLINAIKDILNALMISIFCFSIFSIFGVNFFKGTFHYCLVS